MGIVVDVKYGAWVVKWVRKDLVLARILDGVMPYGAIVAYISEVRLVVNWVTWVCEGG